MWPSKAPSQQDLYMTFQRGHKKDLNFFLFLCEFTDITHETFFVNSLCSLRTVKWYREKSNQELWNLKLYISVFSSQEQEKQQHESKNERRMHSSQLATHCCVNMHLHISSLCWNARKIKNNLKMCRVKISTANAIPTAACCRSEVRRGNYTPARRFYQMLFGLQNTFHDSTVNPLVWLMLCSLASGYWSLATYLFLQSFNTLLV